MSNPKDWELTPEELAHYSKILHEELGHSPTRHEGGNGGHVEYIHDVDVDDCLSRVYPYRPGQDEADDDF